MADVALNGSGVEQLIQKLDENSLEVPQDIVVSEVDEGQPCLVCREDGCPGFAFHTWRNNCVHCKCPRDSHDVYNDNFVNVRDRLGWKRQDDPSVTTSKEKTLREGFTWVPAGLTRDKIEEYMDGLPNHKVPRVGTPGERYRDQQLIRQLPKQDLSDRYCKALSDPAETKEFRIFRELRDQVAMDIGAVKEAPSDATCHGCKGDVDSGEVVVTAAKAGEEKLWHPACFTCSACEELLVDLVYCQHQQQLYCQRHYAQLIRPRCPACDELIFSGEYTKAMDECYHKEHLACWHCDKELVACRYIMKDEHAHCVPCYQQLFAHQCEDCRKPIGPDFKDLSYKDKHWHESCFKCSQCDKSLVDQPFAPKNEKIFCSECYDNSFAARCDGCGNPFKGGMKKFEYKGKQWHDDCFVCAECNVPIGNKSFIPRDDRVICVPCYENNYAQRCSKCAGVINKGGISYKNTPWHRECFTCSQCGMELAGEKFTSKDDQPYCGDCFGDLFAKKCCRCAKPITGMGGTKFISFEDRNWHSECFVCHKCNASMVGQGFLMEGDHIMCPECGRT